MTLTLSQLDKHTQQAIAELTRERIVAEQGGVDLASALLRQRKRRMNQTQTGLLFLLVCVTVYTMSCDLRTCDLCWILHCGPVVVSILQLAL